MRAPGPARRTPRPGVAALLLLVQLGACATSPRAGEPTPETSAGGHVDAERPDLRATCEGLESSILVVPATRADLREAFGPPDSIITVTEPNRHVPGAVDSLFVVHYPGLTSYIRTPTGGGDLVSGVEVSRNRYLRFPQLGIGTSEAQVIDVLGEPTRRGSSSLVYDCGTGAEQPVRFHLDGGAVGSITVEYYVD